MAEIAFVGKAPGRYQLWLGGNAAGTRLNRVFKETIKEAEIEAELRPVLARWKDERLCRRTLRRFRRPRPLARRPPPPRPPDSISELRSPDLPHDSRPNRRQLPPCATALRARSSAGPSPRRPAAPWFRRISARTRRSSCTSPCRRSRISRCCGWTTATTVPPPTATPNSCGPAQTQPEALPPAPQRGPSRRHPRSHSRHLGRGGAQAVQRPDETRAVPARHARTRPPGLDHRPAQGAEPGRAGLDVVSLDATSAPSRSARSSIGATPNWSTTSPSTLPNEWDYFDPAKADEKRECGLHAAWGGRAAAAPAEIGDRSSRSKTPALSCPLRQQPPRRTGAFRSNPISKLRSPNLDLRSPNSHLRLRTNEQ
jgi:hypothetical protein